MTTHEQIKALAELDGCIYVVNRERHGYPISLLIDKETYRPAAWDVPIDIDDLSKMDVEIDETVPAYLTSYDAIIPLIQKQCKQQNGMATEIGCMLIGGDRSAGRMVTQLLCITPAQLCEALLRATGKWKDNE